MKKTPDTYPNQAETEPLSTPLIGDKAPVFEAETTKGFIHFPQDYQGRWVILFSHPSDFTPVCTTEFIMFAKMMNDFKALNTELIGLSVDSLSSHIGWLYAIEHDVNFNGLKNIHIDFPLIADLSTQIARQYGMLHPNTCSTKTVRSVFFIDPVGTIRTILHYPMCTGRNFAELKRILLSLQLNDEYGVSTPADWQPSDDIIIPNPSTVEEAIHAHNRNIDTTSVWFLSLSPIPKDDAPKASANYKNKKNKIGPKKQSKQNKKSAQFSLKKNTYADKTNKTI
ncbi:MAG: peroxiredoxin [Alphaproteobacteria bacterium]|nr:peroxiredoxin [Alphaproteobacteria bacterium]